MVDFIGKKPKEFEVLYFLIAFCLILRKFGGMNINQLYIAKTLTLISSRLIAMKNTDLKYFEIRLKILLLLSFSVFMYIR